MLDWHEARCARMPNILHPIKMVRQGSSNTCWLACLRMLVQRQAARGRPINSTAQTLFDTRFVGRMEQHDRTLVVAQFSTVAGRFGLQSTEMPDLRADWLARNSSTR